MSEVRPLLKEIARPGTFTDASGHVVKFDPEDLAELVAGSEKLMEAGFKVQGSTSHFTDDSRDVLGTWVDLSVDDRGHIIGVFQPFTEEARDLALRLDTSMVAEESVHIADGVSVPSAITRIDVVPQGAIVGTAPFAALAKKTGKRTLFQRPAIEEKAMPDKEELSKGVLMTALAKAVGLQDDAGYEDIEAHLIESLELLNMAEDERLETMAKTLARAFQDEAPKEEEPAPVVAADEAPDEERAAMAAEIADLQADKYEALFSKEMPNEDVALIRSQFTRLRKANVPFREAYAVAESQVKLLSRSLQAMPLNQKPPKNARKAARPAVKEDAETKRLKFSQRLADAATRMGHRRVKEGEL